MKNYYLKNGTRESGPYMLDDLKYQRINANTLVKEEGGNWQPVSQNRDLKFLLDLQGTNNYSDANGNMKQQQQEFMSLSDLKKLTPMHVKRKVTLAVIMAIAIAVAGAAISLYFAVGSGR